VYVWGGAGGTDPLLYYNSNAALKHCHLCTASSTTALPAWVWADPVHPHPIPKPNAKPNPNSDLTLT